MDYRHVFATNLRRFRHEKGFSQEALAYEAGVNRTYMSKLEKGGSFVGLEVMVRLASVLEVEPADFLKPTPRKTARALKVARKR
jgi:transcriptional regulator with XRE-family HTH domain